MAAAREAKTMAGAIDPHTLRKIARYPVRRYVASGGMSWVFEVEDEVLGVRRALKLLKPEAAGGEELHRFANEARLIARFDHPNLLTVYDFGRDEDTGCFYYTMNLVEGTTLSDVEVVPDGDADATRHKGMVCGVLEISGYFVQVLDALACLHAGGIIHRDIKPGNIFLQRDRFGEIRPMLGDLGVARIEGGRSDLTRAGYTIGTPLYMSPEQIRGTAVSPASDVFSFGLTMYHVLIGHSVYEEMEGVDATSGSGVMARLGALLISGKEFDFQFSTLVPEPLRYVIQRACRMKPRERYADAQNLHAALEDACAAVARRSNRNETGKRPWVIGSVLAIALVLAGGGTWVLKERNKSAVSAGLVSDIARTRVQSADALAALEGVKRLPGRPEALVNQAQQELSAVARKLEAAELLLAAGRTSDAAAAQERANVQLDSLCGRLRLAFLGNSVSPGLGVPVATEHPRAAAELGDLAQENPPDVGAAPPDDECSAARSLAESKLVVVGPPQQQPEQPKTEASAKANPAGPGRAAQLPPAIRTNRRRGDETEITAVRTSELSSTAAPSVHPAESSSSRDQQVRSLVTHWCSAVNREEFVGYETRTELSDEVRATFDKRKAEFDEQRCKPPLIAQDGDGYRVDVPIEQIQRDGQMSNVKRRFIARMRVKPEAGSWLIERIDVPDR